MGRLPGAAGSIASRHSARPDRPEDELDDHIEAEGTSVEERNTLGSSISPIAMAVYVMDATIDLASGDGCTRHATADVRRRAFTTDLPAHSVSTAPSNR